MLKNSILNKKTKSGIKNSFQVLSFLVLFLTLSLTLFSQFSQKTYAIEELQNVGIAKYAVLETLKDNTPLRDKDNENAKRITHLFKDSVLFADKQNKNYYRVELNEDNYAWVNKKDVEVQAVIPEKRFDDIEKITSKSTKDKYIFKIDTNSKSAFRFIENANNLNFTFFDVHYNPNCADLYLKQDSSKPVKEISNKTINSANFQISEKIENEFNLVYYSQKPLFGYDIDKTENGYILSIKKAPKINPKKPLKNLVFTLDPGHGGSEKGVCAFNLEEKTINLQITKQLKKELKKQGAKVYLTRTKDKQTDLYYRVNLAKEKRSDFLLSIHQNSLPNIKDVNKKHGTGTYYYHNQSKPLAKCIQESMLKATNFRDDKVNHASFVLTRPTSQLSVLIECGYLIKEEEAQKLKDKKFQKIIAKAIVEGCKNYLIENFI